MRRNDREVTDIKEILKMVEESQVVRLGFSAEEGAYIVPMNFGCRYDEEKEKLYLFLHSAREGRKNDLIKKNPVVGFEMDGMDAVIERELPCSWGAHFHSVMGTGTMRLLTDEEEIQSALDCLMHHYGMEGKGFYQPEMLEKTAVWELEVATMSAKRNR